MYLPRYLRLVHSNYTRVAIIAIRKNKSWSETKVVLVHKPSYLIGTVLVSKTKGVNPNIVHSEGKCNGTKHPNLNGYTCYVL